MKEVGLDYHIGESHVPEGNDDTLDLLDGNYRPRFRAHHRLTQQVVGMLADEVCELVSQTPPGQANIALRTILSDAVTQTAFAIDRVKSVADVRHIAVKLNGVLQSAYQFARIQPTVPSKTLLALLQMSKLMATSHNSGS